MRQLIDEPVSVSTLLDPLMSEVLACVLRCHNLVLQQTGRRYSEHGEVEAPCNRFAAFNELELATSIERTRNHGIITYGPTINICLLGSPTAFRSVWCFTPPEQASEGEGWVHLGWHASEYFAPEQAQLFATVEDLETETAIRVDQPPGLDDFVLLLVNDGADGCGPPVYAALTSTVTGLGLIQAQDASGRSCPDVGQSGSTVFAVAISLLPAHDGQITIDRDWGAAPARVVINVPG